MFLSLIVGGNLELRNEEFDSFDEEKFAIRRFLVCESALVVDVESAALLASFEETLVVDLFPIPFRRALNLRLVAFMVVIWQALPLKLFPMRKKRGWRLNDLTRQIGMPLLSEFKEAFGSHDRATPVPHTLRRLPADKAP
jgi:hypothetical protein